MPSEHPNTRRIEELQKQIEQARSEGRDVSAMERELETLQQPQGQGQSQRQGQQQGQPQGQAQGKGQAQPQEQAKGQPQPKQPSGERR